MISGLVMGFTKGKVKVGALSLPRLLVFFVLWPLLIIMFAVSTVIEWKRRTK